MTKDLKKIFSKEVIEKARKQIADNKFFGYDFDKLPKVYKMWERTCFGNRIQWASWEKRRVVGWLEDIPKKNDRLYVKMKSGRIAIFKFKEIKKSWDPPDMFYADVEDMGYLDELTRE